MPRTPRHSPRILACLVLPAFVAPFAAHAQLVTPDPDPTQLVDRTSEEPGHDREVEIGLFSAYTPLFLGSKDYQPMAGDRKRVVSGKSVSVRVNLGVRPLIKKKTI